MKNASPETIRIRNTLKIGIPAAMLVVAGCYYLITYVLLETLRGIISAAPSIKIASTSLLAPFLMPLALMMLIIPPMKAIPIFESFTKWVEIPVNIIVLVNFIVLILILTTSTFLQNNYMPQLGYSKCNVLQGHPTLWYSDWVKNPDWCVKGKTREWVVEQATAR